MHTLRRLFLYSNCIKKIENLDHLSDLQTLHLNGNKIKIIEVLSDFLIAIFLNYLMETDFADFTLIKTLIKHLHAFSKLNSVMESWNNLI